MLDLPFWGWLSKSSGSLFLGSLQVSKGEMGGGNVYFYVEKIEANNSIEICQKDNSTTTFSSPLNSLSTNSPFCRLHMT